MISPRIRVLHAIFRRLLESNIAADAELPDLAFRWERNRYTSREERPCVALAFVSDEPVEDPNLQNPDEMVLALAFDIIVDMEVETEASAEDNISAGTVLETFDPTGLSKLSLVLDLCLRSLRACTQGELTDTTELGRMIDWVEFVGIDDDEELTDTDGRLVGRANVIYRTSSWDPTVLLERTI